MLLWLDHQPRNSSLKDVLLQTVSVWKGFHVEFILRVYESQFLYTTEKSNWINTILPSPSIGQHANEMNYCGNFESFLRYNMQTLRSYLNIQTNWYHLIQGKRSWTLFQLISTLTTSVGAADFRTLLFCLTCYYCLSLVNKRLLHCLEGFRLGVKRGYPVPHPEE